MLTAFEGARKKLLGSILVTLWTSQIHYSI
jgi:hypothetical protein